MGAGMAQPKFSQSRTVAKRPGIGWDCQVRISVCNFIKTPFELRVCTRAGLKQRRAKAQINFDYVVYVTELSRGMCQVVAKIYNREEKTGSKLKRSLGYCCARQPSPTIANNIITQKPAFVQNIPWNPRDIDFNTWFIKVCLRNSRFSSAKFMCTQ